MSSTFSVPVLELPKFGKHPNADSLSIVQIEGCPCIFKTGDFQQGDKVAYVPVDAMVPLADPRFSFLAKGKEFPEGARSRIKAIRLRGVFSMGLLVKAPDELSLGMDAAEALNIHKHEEQEPVWKTSADAEKDPGFMPRYDMESYRKYRHLLVPGERVIATEKIHGCNARFVYRDGKLWVGSHNRFVKDNPEKASLWWEIARKYDLEKKLAEVPGFGLYGEIYGQVQDLKYGAGPGEIFLRVFDVINTHSRSYLSHDELQQFVKGLGLDAVPVLYDGEYIPEKLEPLAEGQSSLATNIREGIVIRPATERYNHVTGRTLFKLVSEAYLLRKEGTEFH
jgi:RNA ligase (TIGR02306 family)